MLSLKTKLILIKVLIECSHTQDATETEVLVSSLSPATKTDNTEMDIHITDTNNKTCPWSAV